MTSLARQVRYENRSFWRNPAAAFFTIAFPLMFLVIFNLLISGTVTLYGRETDPSNFFVPAIAAFSVITACYTNIAIGTSFARDEGILKRFRGTPLPPAAFLGARVVHAIFVAILLVAIVTLAGAVFYDVDVQVEKLPAFAVAVAVGAAAFCALGLAMSAAVPNAEASPAVVNASILPLLFISDIFIPLDDAPDWLLRLADVFPIRHYSSAMLDAFNPFTDGSGFAWGDLTVVAAWGVAGALLAVRFFSWEPRR